MKVIRMFGLGDNRYDNDIRLPLSPMISNLNKWSYSFAIAVLVKRLCENNYVVQVFYILFCHL